MSFLSESIRNFYENKNINHKSISYTKNIFDSNSELDEFLHEFGGIIENNQKFCENVYLKYIKYLRSSSSFRPNIDEPADIVDLGLLGNELEPLGCKIMNLVLKSLVKNSQTILFDGVYFGHHSKYRKKIEDSFDKFVIIETFHSKIHNINYYEYNGKQLKSVNKIIINLKNNEFISKKEITAINAHINKKIIKLVNNFFKRFRNQKLLYRGIE